jgi:hypothetical protein
MHGPRPHLMLTTSLAALQSQPGTVSAELSGVGPVHAETARWIACDAVCTVLPSPTPLRRQPSVF